MDYEKLALNYHEKFPQGKISIKNTKPLNTQEDLSLAYSPGVAGPCRKIALNPDDSFKYTTRGNLVAVISNGSAVLGLGNIGPYAAKPVMEGKGMLFKKFADIDVFDIEVNCSDPDEFIKIVASLEPTFGGINLEDIKAPECFYIEEKLKQMMSIPVFHDDQHGTAIIAGAALINACEIIKKDFAKIKVVFCGAGAAAIGCAELLLILGVKKENIILCDSTGVLTTKRQDLNSYKQKFATKEEKLVTMADALKGADVFIGVSGPDVLTPDMLKSMAKDPIVFALANPDPEIKPELAIQVRSDVIIATGRSDYPNQVNNVLGFPYLFRGALDVRARTINNEMKLAAVYAIAALAKENVPEEVMTIYGHQGRYEYGRNYLIPKPVDQRVLLKVAPAVAKAAMDTGVARQNINLEEYTLSIERILGPTRRIVRKLRQKSVALQEKGQKKPKVLLACGADERILKAAKQIIDSNEIDIYLLGPKEKILSQSKGLGLDSLLEGKIFDPLDPNLSAEMAEKLYLLRQRKGISRSIAQQLVTQENYMGAMLLHEGAVDAYLTGLGYAYRDAIKPLLQLIKPKSKRVPAGIYMMVKDDKRYFFSDCTVNVNPTWEQLVDITLSTIETASQYTTQPIKVAMLGFASFGDSKNPESLKVAKAVEVLQRDYPHLNIDGEMQADVALDEILRGKEFPFCKLQGNANVLIFPNLAAANISYKLLMTLGGVEATGPILVGLDKPCNVLQRGALESEIISMIYICAYQAMMKKVEVKA